MKSTLFGWLFARILVFDLLFVIATVAAWVFSYEIHDLAGVVGSWLLAHLLRMVTWIMALRWSLGPLLVSGAERSSSDQTLVAADEALTRLPLRVTVVYTLGWAVVLGLVPVFIWAAGPRLAELGLAELIAGASLCVGTGLGLPVLIYPLLQWSLDEPRAIVATELALRGLERRTRASSVNQRLLLMAFCLALAPLASLSSLFWLGEIRTARSVALQQQREAVEQAVHELEHGVALPETFERARKDQLPAQLAAQLDAERQPQVLGAIDVRREQVLTAVALGPDSWVVARGPVSFEQGEVWAAFAVSILAVIVWALGAMLALARTITAPLHRLRDATARVVEVGDLGAMGSIPAVHADEVGDLAGNFNRMIETFKELAAAAEAVARGDLHVTIDGVGELPDAFRSMVAQLEVIVVELRETAAGVATAAAEIHAATLEQERAAERQSAGMDELDQTMVSLTESAGQVFGAATGVLHDAERTRETNDETARQIGELSVRSRGIDELLALIRDIASRSDLLALNGSLEATRAGDAGRGFALVASEMRRLAERVSAAVSDVGELVTGIQSASAATVMVTEQSRKLSEATAAAARSITEESERQSSETQRASQRVREVGETIVQAGAATTQTRAAAEDLRAQARQLEQLVGRFALRDEAGDGGSSSAQRGTKIRCT